MIRGFVVVDVMNPKEAEEKLLPGFPKFTVLVKLKNSVRNCRLPNSLMGKIRATARSIFRCPGPLAIPTPQLPKSVAFGSVPTVGAVVNAAGLK